MELDPESTIITIFLTHVVLFRYKRYCLESNQQLSSISMRTVHSVRHYYTCAKWIITQQTIMSSFWSFTGTWMSVQHELPSIYGDQVIWKWHWSKRRTCPSNGWGQSGWNTDRSSHFPWFGKFNARFIHNFAMIGVPLRKLTHKGVKFEFGPDQRSAFCKLKSV